jgi:flagellar basal-body rod modification protein FlgD
MSALSSATTKSATSTATRSATSSTGTGSSSTSQIGNAAGMGKDDFMQLLVAQLKNQDPMKPMDDKEFVTQLAQFSALEASQKMTETIEALSASEMIVQAATLIGKQATAKLPTGETVTGVISQVKIQDGKPIAVINGKDVDTSLITQIGS